MNETQLQDKFIIPFFRDTLGYQEVKANTVSNSLIIEEDLEAFISTTELNQEAYKTLLKKYDGNKKKGVAELRYDNCGQGIFWLPDLSPLSTIEMSRWIGNWNIPKLKIMNY